MPTDETLSVSPYLLRPLRSYEEALRDRMELRNMRERALQGMRQRLFPEAASHAARGNGD